MHISFLAHPVAPVLSLLVIVGIEVEVMHDHRVGGSQVDSKATLTVLLLIMSL